jgi:heme oxygenase
MRYVIEGSALGGRVIRRRLDLTLPAACRGATRFFDGEDGGASGEPPSWAAFWRGVDALGPIDAEAAAAAARRLFAEIEALWDRHLWLRRTGAR